MQHATAPLERPTDFKALDAVLAMLPRFYVIRLRNSNPQQHIPRALDSTDAANLLAFGTHPS